MNSASLPVIDLAELERRGGGALAAALDQACTEHGFFYLRGHGIAPALIDDCFAAARRFFALDEAVKQRWHIDRSAIRRGYDPLGWQALDPDAPADLKESFYLGVDRGPEDPLVAAGVPQQGPNQWPDEARVPGFAAATRAYQNALATLATRVLDAMGLGLGLTSGHFERYLRDPMPVLRLLHYPALPPASSPRQMGCGAHTDWGSLTLLMQDGAGGLEVETRDGTWLAAPPLEGAFVVNLGDLMARWTNDRYRSTRHRVRPPIAADGRSRERYSIAYFLDVDFDARIEALPGCTSPAHPPRYAPITAGEHIVEMYRLTQATTA